jgi:hypothetical protein
VVRQMPAQLVRHVLIKQNLQGCNRSLREWP